MSKFEISDPNYRARIKESFEHQTIMETIGASLLNIDPGIVEIELPYSNKLCQQNEFLHAGVLTTIVDSACGYAAYTLMPAEADILTVEFKVNFINPGVGDKFIARGEVIKAGKTITVSRGEVYSFNKDEKKQIALMQSTLIRR